jgi:hypothetical protein
MINQMINPMNIGISLGWNCESASYGVKYNLRKRKANGYNTCVFDEMVSNYPGIIECIQDDFKYFLDLEYIELKDIGEIVIYNKKYKFWFNHESPGHANLYKKQNWAGGINHFVDNNYEKFIERYQQRINNFRNYIKSKNNITFILNRYNTNKIDDIPSLVNTIKQVYPLLNFNFIFICTKSIDFIGYHLKLMGFDDSDDEVIRLK